MCEYPIIGLVPFVDVSKEDVNVIVIMHEFRTVWLRSILVNHLFWKGSPAM